jgi:hypothetical protein
MQSFGHSAAHVSLLTSRAGFDALYFGRIDYQDLAEHKLANVKECGNRPGLSNLLYSYGLARTMGTMAPRKAFALTFFAAMNPWSERTRCGLWSV